MTTPSRLAIPPNAAAISADVRHVLQPTFLREALARGVPGYRARILTIEVMALCLLHLVLARLPSLAEVVHDLRLGALPGVPRTRVSLSAFYKRLAALPHTVFLGLLRHVSAALQAVLPRRTDVAALAPWAAGIYAIDDTTLDALARKTAALQRAGDGRYAALGGRLSTAFDLVTGTFAALIHDTDSASNEKNRLLALVEALGAGVLVVLDRGDFAFELFDALSARFVYFVTRLKKKVTYEVVATFAETPLYRDRLVYLGGATSTDRGAWPVRLVELRLDGEWWSYVTNVCDPRRLPADALWRLYSHRWRIEVAFAAVKRALGLATLHACHVQGVLSQVWATLLVYQVLHALRERVAVALALEPDAISWEKLMRRIGVYVSQRHIEALPDWLVARAVDLGVVKSGRRVRRRTTLPLALRTHLTRPQPALDPADLTPRRAVKRPPRFPERGSQRTATGLLHAHIASENPLDPA